MGKNIIYVLIAIPLFLAIDMFSRFLYAQSWLSKAVLSNEIDPFDIFSLLLSTAVAIWLGWYITRKLSAQRYQKEYLISDIKQIEDEITFVERNMQVSNMELQTILELLTKFKLYLDRFSKTIEIFEITSINSKKLFINYNLLYQRTTNTDGTHFNIDESVRIEINKICSSIIYETRKMIYAINNE